MNSIVAGNLAESAASGPDVFRGGEHAIAARHSLVGSADGHDIPATSGNLVGVDAGFVMDGYRPLLADNGGETWTHALLAGSPARDAADASSCAAAPVNALDQRGVQRTPEDGCDMGAWEGNDVPPTPVSVSALAISGGAVDRDDGTAYVTGTMVCDDPGVVNLVVRVDQAQKQRRLTVAVTGSAAASVPCEGTTSWAVAVSGSDGVFLNGDVTVSAATSNVDPAREVAATVKLFWSKELTAAQGQKRGARP